LINPAPPQKQPHKPSIIAQSGAFAAPFQLVFAQPPIQPLIRLEKGSQTGNYRSRQKI
jgi:hypothetical protein